MKRLFGWKKTARVLDRTLGYVIGEKAKLKNRIKLLEEYIDGLHWAYRAQMDDIAAERDFYKAQVEKSEDDGK